MSHYFSFYMILNGIRYQVTLLKYWSHYPGVEYWKDMHLTTFEPTGCKNYYNSLPLVTEQKSTLLNVSADISLSVINLLHPKFLPLLMHHVGDSMELSVHHTIICTPANYSRSELFIAL